MHVKKVLFIATVVKTHIHAFHLPYIKMFKEKGYETYVAAKNDYGNSMPDIPNCDCYIDLPFSRSPFSLRNIKAYKMLKALIDENHFDIIQCNTPVGGVLGRLAARKARKNGAKVIYIAHGFHFMKGSSVLSWLLFFPIEKLLAHVTDVLVTINREDYDRAKRKLKAKKTVHVNGMGVAMENITGYDQSRHTIRVQLGIKDSDILIASVGELTKNKNHKTALRALARLNHSAIHYVIAGSGSFRKQLGQYSRQLGLDNVHWLGFCDRGRIYELLRASDIFCFPSCREGLPVALMEAMAAGLPIVASAVRGNTDLIVPGKGGLLYAPDDVEGFADGIHILMQNPELRYRMGAYNKERVREYDIKNIKKVFSDIYFPSEDQIKEAVKVEQFL